MYFLCVKSGCVGEKRDFKIDVKIYMINMYGIAGRNYIKNYDVSLKYSI